MTSYYVNTKSWQHSASSKLFYLDPVENHRHHRLLAMDGFIVLVSFVEVSGIPGSGKPGEVVEYYFLFKKGGSSIGYYVIQMKGV